MFNLYIRSDSKLSSLITVTHQAECKCKKHLLMINSEPHQKKKETLIHSALQMRTLTTFKSLNVQ